MKKRNLNTILSGLLATSMAICCVPTVSLAEEPVESDVAEEITESEKAFALYEDAVDAAMFDVELLNAKKAEAEAIFDDVKKQYDAAVTKEEAAEKAVAKAEKNYNSAFEMYVEIVMNDTKTQAEARKLYDELCELSDQLDERYAEQEKRAADLEKAREAVIVEEAGEAFYRHIIEDYDPYEEAGELRAEAMRALRDWNHDEDDNAMLEQIFEEKATAFYAVWDKYELTSLGIFEDWDLADSKVLEQYAGYGDQCDLYAESIERILNKTESIENVEEEFLSLKPSTGAKVRGFREDLDEATEAQFEAERELNDLEYQYIECWTEVEAINKEKDYIEKRNEDILAAGKKQSVKAIRNMQEEYDECYTRLEDMKIALGDYFEACMNDEYNLSDCSVSVSPTSLKYDGKAKKPEVIVYCDGKALPEMVYEVEYSDNTMAGIGHVTVSPAADSKTIGVAEGKFTITADTPKLLSCTAVETGVELKWEATKGATKYRVYRKLRDGSFARLPEGDTTETTFVDMTAVSGKNYVYTVRVISEDGSAAVSDYYKPGLYVTYCDAPTLVSVANNASSIKFTWSASKGAEKYRVYRKLPGESWKKIASTTSTSYEDKNVTAGKTYYYTVRCVNAKENTFTSGYNKTGIKIVRLTQPAVSVAKTSKGIKSSWKAITGAKTYRVYRKVSGGSWERLKDVTTLNYVDTTAKKGTTYYYTVRAINGSSMSSYKASKAIKR